MHYEVLDAERREILPLLKVFKERFYLAGGTGLALQIGHRVSADFDFFTEEHIGTGRFIQELNDLFRERGMTVTLEEKDSLNVVVGDAIKLSFLRYAYPLLQPCVEDDNLRVASIADIACMKLAAVVSRAAAKDFVDIYFILKQIALSAMLEYAAEKMPALDRNLALKGLIYFEDVEEGGIIFRPGFDVSFAEVKKTLEQEVKKLPIVP